MDLFVVIQYTNTNEKSIIRYGEPGYYYGPEGLKKNTYIRTESGNAAEVLFYGTCAECVEFKEQFVISSSFNSSRKRTHEFENFESSKNPRFDSSISTHLNDVCSLTNLDEPTSSSKDPSIDSNLIEKIKAEIKEELAGELESKVKKLIEEEVKKQLGEFKTPNKNNNKNSKVDIEIRVNVNNKQQSLSTVDHSDLIKAIRGNQESMRAKIPNEIDISKIESSFGLLLLDSFKTDTSRFAYLIAESIMEPEVFKIAYLPHLINPQRKHTSRDSTNKKTLNSKVVACILFLIDYYGGSTADEVSKYRLLQDIRESFTDRVNNFRRKPVTFSNYLDNSAKPFNLENAF